MNKFIEIFFNFIFRISPSIIVGVVVFTIISLSFFSNKIPEDFVALDFREKSVFILQSVSLLFTSLLMGIGLVEIFKIFFLKKIKDSLAIREKQKLLKNLTPKEQEILRYYIDNKTKTQELFNSGELVSLIKDEMLYHAKDNIGCKADYNINNWALEYLKKYPELVGIIK